MQSLSVDAQTTAVSDGCRLPSGVSGQVERYWKAIWLPLVQEDQAACLMAPCCPECQAMELIAAVEDSLSGPSRARAT